MLNPEAIEETLYSWKHRFEISPRNPTALFEELNRFLPHIAMESWHERAAFGGLYVNGARVTTERSITSRSIVEYYEPKYPYRKAEDFYPSFSTKSIVYEDDHFAVVFKPIGLPTHPNKEQTAHSLRTYLERYYRRRVHLPSRLDTATCGLVPVSIHGMMHQQLQRLFERRLVEKCYLCGVDSPPPADHFCVDAPIRRSAIHAVLREVGEPGGDPAETHFEFLNAVEGRSGTTYYLHAYPITGRTHQIRVHLASFVGPIRGDRFYGGPPAEELHLMCSKLSLFHPVLKKQITVVAPRRLLPEWAKAAEIVAS